ncbi:MAG TPA: TlpA disulfide reductase family protein [Burkholderiales bacterium]|nr:TlpA disulfide reductase family protein [Burkholderiales bacterium]
MSRSRQVLLLIAVGLIALSAGYLVSRHSADSISPAGDGVREGSAALLAASLPDMAGKAQRLEQWKGKILVVNFWATWCEPCREEIPALIRTQRQFGNQGVQIVGIAIDEPDKVKPYAAQMGINYPILVGELEALELTRAAGNQVGGLPYTVVFNRAGQIITTRLGGITEGKLEAIVRPLL